MKTLLIHLIFVCILGAFFCFIDLQEKKQYVANVYKSEYWGAVDTVFRDPDHRMVLVAMLNTGTKISLNQASYFNVRKGDILFKLPNSFKHFFVRNGDTTAYFRTYGGKDTMNKLLDYCDFNSWLGT